MISAIEKPIRVYLKGSRYSSKNRRLLGFIRNNLTSDFSVRFSTNLDAFLAALKHQIISETGTAVLCGGDGMVHYAIQLLAGTSVAMLPLPGGTANDLSRELGWCPLSFKPVSTERRNIDCLRVNNRLMATVGGCGHGADVIRRIRSMNSKGLDSPLMSRIFGKWIYAIGSAERAFRRAQTKALYVIDSNKGSWKGVTSSIFVCNQGTLAGTFTVCKSSKNRDGQFEVVVPKPASGIATLYSGLASVLFRSPLTKSATCFLSTKNARIVVQSGPQCDFFADGELLPRAPNNEYRISMESRILTVVRRL